MSQLTMRLYQFSSPCFKHPKNLIRVFQNLERDEVEVFNNEVFCRLIWYQKYKCIKIQSTKREILIFNLRIFNMVLRAGRGDRTQRKQPSPDLRLR